MQTTRISNHIVPDSVLQEYLRIQTQITRKNFNFEHFVSLMEIKGKIMYGQHFKLYQEDNHVLLQFYAYFTGDEDLCKHYDINVNKGLFLSGKTGVGKTVHMKLVRQFLGYKDRFRMKTCQQLSLEYMDQGSPVLMNFGRNYVDYVDHNTINTSYCFDDLGTEDEVRHFGTQANAMGQVILMRYNLFQTRQVLTHFTSNLTADQIEHHYGERVRSRLREMCNWIQYTAESPDKRK